MTKYLLLLPALTGCIIIEGEKSTPDWDVWDTGWDESDEWEDWQEDSGEDEANTEDSQEEDSAIETSELGFYLMPSAGAPGDVFRSTLRSNQTIDWADIVNVTPYGDLKICNFSPLFDELLLTVQVDNDAGNGTVDLVIEYSNGDVDLVEDGFTIDANADVGSAATDPSVCE
jgi:hypothetical protein